MERLTTTPFGRRPVTAGLLATARAARNTTPLPRLAKWTLFRQLATARKTFGLSDRNLTVLNALLTFLPGDVFDARSGLIVFPSNATLAGRCHGMAESTLRRHISALVEAGIVLRHDSPNGKRYAAKRADGSIYRAFGLDLTPMLERAAEIAEAAERAIQEQDAIKREREAVMCLKRDAIKLLDYARDSDEPGNWEALAERLAELHRMSRCKMTFADWSRLRKSFEMFVDKLELFLAVSDDETEEMIGTGSQNERHLHNSDKDTFDSEDDHQGRMRLPTMKPLEGSQPALPLPLIIQVCPDIALYAEKPPSQWHDLVNAASRVYPMIGITPETWAHATIAMGPKNAATTIAAMVQRINTIKAPGAYLRSLANKAREGKFSPAPMIMALMRTEVPG